jgi:hypothetical protein
MHPRYLIVKDIYYRLDNHCLYCTVWFQVKKTGKYYRLYDEHAKRFIAGYKWGEI